MDLVIESVANKRVKQWRKLHTNKGRHQQSRYLIEGFHLVEEALKWVSNQVETIIHTGKLMELFDSNDHISYIQVTDEVFTILSQTQAPQGIMAVMKMPNPLIEWEKGKYLLVDAVQDPGNLGTMIRTASAAGFTGVVLGDGTVDVYNDKVIRASQGAIWQIPVISLNLGQAIDQLKQDNHQIFATQLYTKAVSYRDVPIEQYKQCGIIVGNEGQGVSEAIVNLADQAIYIPMPGKSESLNVAVATGILLFHTLAY